MDDIGDDKDSDGPEMEPDPLETDTEGPDISSSLLLTISLLTGTDGSPGGSDTIRGKLTGPVMEDGLKLS